MSSTAIMAFQNACNLARMVAIALTDKEVQYLMRANDEDVLDEDLPVALSLREMKLLCRLIDEKGAKRNTITPWGMFVCAYIEEENIRE